MLPRQDCPQVLSVEKKARDPQNSKAHGLCPGQTCDKIVRVGTQLSIVRDDGQRNQARGHDKYCQPGSEGDKLTHCGHALMADSQIS